MCDTDNNSSVTSAGQLSSWLPVQWISGRDTSNQPTTNTSHASFCEELNALKHQLMPAAKSCAEAINDFHQQNGSKERTNPSYEYRRARSMCNLYETLGETIHNNKSKKGTKKKRNSSSPSGISQFVNRSAIKLANIDALMGFCLTHPPSGPHNTTAKYFAFVDLCGAPGGFSEYIMHRRVNPVDHECKKDIDGDEYKKNGGSSGSSISVPCYGFGMSLQGSNEDGTGLRWDLSHLERYRHRQYISSKKRKCSNQHSVMHYSVCNGSDGTGSIYSWDNVKCLQREVASTLSPNNSHACELQTDGEVRNGLVHLVVADGGFDAQRDSSSQEDLAHRLVVSQIAAALLLLRPGGKFVIKMFGFHLEKTKRVLQYLLDRFEMVGIFKPIVSRPASAERYLVCCGYDGLSDEWDGLVWKGEMMREGQATSDGLRNHFSEGSWLINSFDMKMLQLNIDSCRSIVKYLDERRLAAKSGAMSKIYDKRRDIDPYSYEQLWQL